MNQAAALSKQHAAAIERKDALRPLRRIEMLFERTALSHDFPRHSNFIAVTLDNSGEGAKRRNQRLSGAFPALSVITCLASFFGAMAQ